MAFRDSIKDMFHIGLKRQGYIILKAPTPPRLCQENRKRNNRLEENICERFGRRKAFN